MTVDALTESYNETLAELTESELNDLESRLYIASDRTESPLEALGLIGRAKLVREETIRRNLAEARERALKVPDPQFLLGRLGRREEALLLSGSSHEALVGIKFLLINERVREGEPTMAFGRVTFTEEPGTIKNVEALGRRSVAVDPLMLREFKTRDGPFNILKLKLEEKFATPKKVQGIPAGRFSALVTLGESTEVEEERLVEAGLKPSPDGSCPDGYPVKRKDAATGETRCFLQDTMTEGEHLPTSKAGLTVEQSFAKIEEMGRKFTQEEANFVQRSPLPERVCGACRFYLRDPSSDIGKCQVVDGPIKWFATSDLYISAAEEASAAFEVGEAQADPERKDSN